MSSIQPGYRTLDQDDRVKMWKMVVLRRVQLERFRRMLVEASLVLETSFLRRGIQIFSLATTTPKKSSEPSEASVTNLRYSTRRYP